MTLNPPEAPTAERRKDPRFQMLLPVFLQRCDGTVFENSTYTRDVSSSGIFFYLDAEIREGARVEFKLGLPPGDLQASSIQVEYRGQVTRVHRLPNGTYGVAATMQKSGFGNA